MDTIAADILPLKRIVDVDVSVQHRKRKLEIELEGLTEQPGLSCNTFHFLLLALNQAAQGQTGSSLSLSTRIWDSANVSSQLKLHPRLPETVHMAGPRANHEGEIQVLQVQGAATYDFGQQFLCSRRFLEERQMYAEPYLKHSLIQPHREPKVGVPGPPYRAFLQLS